MSFAPILLGLRSGTFYMSPLPHRTCQPILECRSLPMLHSRPFPLKGRTLGDPTQARTIGDNRAACHLNLRPSCDFSIGNCYHSPHPFLKCFKSRFRTAQDMNVLRCAGICQERGCPAAGSFPAYPSRSATRGLRVTSMRCIGRYVVRRSRMPPTDGAPTLQHPFAAVTFQHKTPRVKSPGTSTAQTRRRHRSLHFLPLPLLGPCASLCHVQAVLPARHAQRRLRRGTRSTAARSDCVTSRHACLTRHGRTGEGTSRFAHRRNALSNESATSRGDRAIGTMLGTASSEV